MPCVLSSNFPHQCGVHIGLYTPSSRWGFRFGYRTVKGVSERCIVRLLLTVNYRFAIITKVTVKLRFSGDPLEKALLLNRESWCHLFLIIHVYLDSFLNGHSSFTGTLKNRVPSQKVLCCMYFFRRTMKSERNCRRMMV